MDKVMKEESLSLVGLRQNIHSSSNRVTTNMHPMLNNRKEVCRCIASNEIKCGAAHAPQDAGWQAGWRPQAGDGNCALIQQLHLSKIVYCSIKKSMIMISRYLDWINKALLQKIKII